MFRRLTFFITLAIILSDFIDASATVTGRQAFENSFSQSKMEDLKQEVVKSFTLYGEPITPVAIKTFSPWLSDLAPSVIALDLNATVDSNQYAGDVVNRNGSLDVTEQTETDGYRILGHFGDDKVVLASYSLSSTGTGVWTSILILKISVTPLAGFNFQQSQADKRYALLAELIGFYSVPDRGGYTLEGTTLLINDRKEDAGTGAKVSIDLSALVNS